MSVKKTAIFTLAMLSFYASGAVSGAQDIKEWPIFDAHIHYSHDIWEAFPPKEAIRRLKAAGIRQALVSSSSDEGTQKLYNADPEFVIPALRPYRKRGTLETWLSDKSVIPYLKQRLEKYPYAAIGEFHIEGEEAMLPVLQEIAGLARQYNLFLHVHSDAKAIELIFKQDPQARILWAHAGFEDARTVARLMGEHRQLWADLSFRQEIFNNGQFMPDWQALLVTHADRFLLGIDTYEPPRWLQINTVMQWQHQLLEALPENVARKIAWQNGEYLVRVYRTRKEKRD